MNGIAPILRALHHGERTLVDQLLAAAERHHAEHEIHHVTTDLARWSEEHVSRLGETARGYGLDLPSRPPDRTAVRSAGTTPRKEAADTPEGRSETGLLLLQDLRDLYLAAAGNSLYWEMLAQAAQATNDTGLLQLASSCHPQTLRQIRWANTMIKNLSPQLLTS